ncbi:MAG: hypothetical protein HQL68_04525 [Magnetococcales bacterium]|nr:hypothetical protein [Magnetococcales bacterium]
MSDINTNAVLLQISHELGELRGDVNGIATAQQIQGKKLDRIDNRLRNVEMKSTVMGGVAGFATAYIKTRMGIL